MALVSSNIHGCLEHDYCEWNAWDPAPEAEGGKERKDHEHDPSAPEMLVEVVDCCSNCDCDVENASDPDELLSEVLRSEKVCPGEDESNGQDEGEQDDGVGIERKIVLRIVYSSTAKAVIFGVLVEGEARDCDEAAEYCYQLESVSSVQAVDIVRTHK